MSSFSPIRPRSARLLRNPLPEFRGAGGGKTRVGRAILPGNAAAGEFTIAP